MRISGITYVQRKTPKWKIFFVVLFLLTLVTILASAVITLITGWNVLYMEELLDFLMSKLMDS